MQYFLSGSEGKFADRNKKALKIFEGFFILIITIGIFRLWTELIKNNLFA